MDSSSAQHSYYGSAPTGGGAAQIADAASSSVREGTPISAKSSDDQAQFVIPAVQASAAPAPSIGFAPALSSSALASPHSPSCYNHSFYWPPPTAAAAAVAAAAANQASSQASTLKPPLQGGQQGYHVPVYNGAGSYDSANSSYAPVTACNALPSSRRNGDANGVMHGSESSEFSHSYSLGYSMPTNLVIYFLLVCVMQ